MRIKSVDGGWVSCAIRPAAVAVALLAPQSIMGQSDSSAGGQTAVVVAGEQYESAPGGMLFFGKDYRDLWAASISVQVLDLHTVAGGLQPVKRVGGESSKGLALRGADGRDYTFRSVDKDLTGSVPVEFQDTVLVDIVQDQVAGNYPGVQVVKPPLARAVGVLTVDEARLVVMPDDPILGEYRQGFAGVLGTFLEYPQPRSATNPGFHGATEILGHSEFWERRQATPDDPPDTRAFLRARLLDIFLNDFDRHRKQWRWARIPGESHLQPIPEDPDMAFTDYEGVALGMARFMGAPYVKFEAEYPPLPSITKNGWDVDRFLLTNIEKPEWMEIAADVQARLTDPVIEEALRRVPPEYFELRGAEIDTILKGRRDRLSEYAERYYRYMARDVDVQCTNVSEVARVAWLDSGDLAVSVARLNADGTTDTPYYRRRFKRDETKEVRIYLRGGNDRVVTAGAKGRGIKVRAIGGPGNDTVDDSEGRGIRFYDSQGDNRVMGGNGTSLDSRPFIMPPRPEPNDVAWVPNQDWGRVTTPIVALGYAGDPGLILGGGFNTKGHGFRKYPEASTHSLEAAWAFGASEPFIDYLGTFRRQNSNVNFALNARLSGLEQLRYYGLGNETEYDQSVDSIYKVSDLQYELYPTIAISEDLKNYFAIGPFLQYSDSDGTDPDTILGQEQPLGFGKLGQIGFKAKLALDTRKGKDVFAGGIDLKASGDYFLEAWDVEDHFGSIEGEFHAHLPMGKRLLLDPFIGGKQVWGDYPYFEAAYIGHRTTRGYGWNRFAGDASLYGGVELDVVVSKLRAVVPGDFGFSFFADAGRVFLEGEDSNKWHPSYGGGVFYAPFERTSLYGVTFGDNDDGFFVLIEARVSGFGF